MDTSQEYIQMCEKATEIQEIKRNKNYPSHLASQYWQTTSKQIIDIDGDFLGEIEDLSNFCSTRYIWLPRQDQLQETLDTLFLTTKDINGIVNMIASFDLWCRQNWPPFTSMEQLWLAFTMKEKFKKAWNGEDWIKE